MDELTRIIENVNMKPIIVNPKSNFVVITYWWGRDNQNRNTARPCISYYEDIMNVLKNLCIKTYKFNKLKSGDNLVNLVLNNGTHFSNTVKYLSVVYLNSVREYLKMLPIDYPSFTQPLSGKYTYKNTKKDWEMIKIIETLKLEGKTPQEYTYRNLEECMETFRPILILMLIFMEPFIQQFIDLNLQIGRLKNEMRRTPSANTTRRKQIHTEIIQINTKNGTLTTQMLLQMKRPKSHDEIMNHNYTTLLKDTFINTYDNISIHQMLDHSFRFINSLSFDDMILQWQRECERNNCNHMAVEFPEFVGPGGYQMAINAKPLFIRKALQVIREQQSQEDIVPNELLHPVDDQGVCRWIDPDRKLPRSIVYIDGDMYIRQYPAIFDMVDVDYMARGWWCDPRASTRVLESITYDPYTFETSGGIMYFSQSAESMDLLNTWIKITESPSQAGKADDRLISLIFNTKKLLLQMKVIQLPVEYLWLSLSYDMLTLERSDHSGEPVDDLKDIYVEHPECLTSEDTAAGSGASSSRQPKFYDYLEENIDPVSEQFNEFIMFPNKEIAKGFEKYLTFMKGAHYMWCNCPAEEFPACGCNDKFENFLAPMSDDERIEGYKEENEQPLYIVDYKHRYGNIKYPYNYSENYDTGITYNHVADQNLERIVEIDLNWYKLDINADIVEITDVKLFTDKKTGKVNHTYILCTIIKLLCMGKRVIYRPKDMDGYNEQYNQLLLEKNIPDNNNEFIFVPKLEPKKSTNFMFKPGIYTNQVIMF